jgi:hypothetical protein
MNKLKGISDVVENLNVANVPRRRASSISEATFPHNMLIVPVSAAIFEEELTSVFFGRF